MHLSTCFRESTSLKSNFNKGKKEEEDFHRERERTHTHRHRTRRACAHISLPNNYKWWLYGRWLVWKKRLMFVSRERKKKRREEQCRRWRQQAAVGEYEEEEGEERRKERKIILCRPTPSFYLTWTHTTLLHTYKHLRKKNFFFGQYASSKRRSSFLKR